MSPGPPLSCSVAVMALEAGGLELSAPTSLSASYLPRVSSAGPGGVGWGCACYTQPLGQLGQARDLSPCPGDNSN